jgi:DNA polymerase III delta prime subunit
MKPHLLTKITKMLKNKNTSSILISHPDKVRQLQTLEIICRTILKIPQDHLIKTHQDIFGIWSEHITGNSIKIEQIHEFIRKIQLKPYASKYKIGVILEAEKMTSESQNALLKTLEEPPSNTFIILTVNKISYLLPTIVSRCQIMELYSYNENSINQNMVDGILSASLIERFETIEKIIQMKNKEKRNELIEELLSCLQLHFRNSLLTSFSDNQKREENLSVVQFIDLTKRAVRHNVNIRLALENLMMQIPLNES